MARWRDRSVVTALCSAVSANGGSAASRGRDCRARRGCTVRASPRGRCARPRRRASRTAALIPDRVGGNAEGCAARQLMYSSGVSMLQLGRDLLPPACCAPRMPSAGSASVLAPSCDVHARSSDRAAVVCNSTEPASIGCRASAVSHCERPLTGSLLHAAKSTTCNAASAGKVSSQLRRGTLYAQRSRDHLDRAPRKTDCRHILPAAPGRTATPAPPRTRCRRSSSLASADASEGPRQPCAGWQTLACDLHKNAGAFAGRQQFCPKASRCRAARRESRRSFCPVGTAR